MRRLPADPAEERSPTEAPQAAEPRPAPELTPEGLLQLQRSGGNRAVQRMLASAGRPTLARFSDVLVRDRAGQTKDWIEAKIQVRAYEIHTATKRDDEQANYFEAKKQVEEAWQHFSTLKSGGVITAAEWELMKLGLSTEEYATAVSLADTAIGTNWGRAAQLLSAMPLHDAYQRLASLTGPQLIQLGQGAVGALAGAPAQEMARRISVVQGRPGNAAPHADYVRVDTPGKEEHKAKVGGGEVDVRTGGVTTSLGSGKQSNERFSLGYQGAESEKTRWLQFIWREVEVDDPVKGRFRVNQPVTTTGGTYNLTTDPSKPSYNTDTASPASPFYESTGINNRTADATTIFDLPAPMQAVVDTQFDGGATKVVSRAHFISYLVRDMEVLYKVELDVEWEFTAKGAAPPRKQGVKSAGAAKELDPEQRKRLIVQFPKFDYLP